MTPAQLAAVAHITRCPAKNIESNWPMVEGCMRDLRVLPGPLTAVAAIATVAVETDYTFRPIREEGSEAYLRAKKYFPFYGRGFIQTTWRANYEALGQALGVDLLAEPDRALTPAVASVGFALFWRDRHCHVPAELENWTRVRELVNGGHNGLAEFRAMCLDLKEVLCSKPSQS